MAVEQSKAAKTEDDLLISVKDTSVMFEMERGYSKVLDNINIDIYDEEIIGVVGESGSGKSMFASSLLDAVVDPGQLTGDITYYPPSGGEIDILELEENEVKKLRWEEISFVFQGAMSSWNPTLTLRKHFVETLEAHDADLEEGIERAHQLLSDVYLDSERVLSSYPHELSGGMKQRALIALSLILEPNVLILDEPTASLDLLMQRAILNLIDELQQAYDLTIIFVTHDLPLVSELSDRLAVMYAFEFVEVGPTKRILEQSAHPYTRGLLNSTPNLESDINEMKAIEGASPDPVNPPDGCSYHPRCSLADSTCEAQNPEQYRVNETHSAACHHWEEVDSEIPLQHHRSDIASSDSSKDGQFGDNYSEEVVTIDDLKIHFSESTSLKESLFSEGEVVKAVDGVSMSIYENQIITLVGESGCGKTTLGYGAIGVQRPTEGKIAFRGQDIWEAQDHKKIPFLGDTEDIDIPFDRIRRSLQMIHQDPGAALNPNRKLIKSISEPLKKWKDLNRSERQERVLSMLERVGMTPAEDFAYRYPHQLSGGEQQRATLIRALLMDPELMIADEAVSALDVSLRIEMMDLFLELQEEFGTAYIFISHNLSNARYITEKVGGLIAIMYLGEIVEIGTAEQIIANPRHPYTKALVWATPTLRYDADKDDDVPLRNIDIPDPKNPPSGCRFHSRCPEAREVCKEESPSSIEVDPPHEVSCFREDDSHEYWESEPLESK